MSSTSGQYQPSAMLLAVPASEAKGPFQLLLDLAEAKFGGVKQEVAHAIGITPSRYTKAWSDGTGAAACEADGHQWGEWLEYLKEALWNLNDTARQRSCLRCGLVDGLTWNDIEQKRGRDW